MFGDIGHGLVLLCFSLFLIFRPPSLYLLNKIKYLLLLMGIFAIYCGFIYNDFFSFPFIIQDSCYDTSTMS